MGMTPYYIMLLIIVVCALKFKDGMSEANKNRLLIISLIPMFCLFAFKSENVGTDTENYLRMFIDLGTEIDRESRIELGYQYMCVFLTKYFGTIQSLFIFSSFVICSSLYVFIKRTATNYPLALYFFATLGFFQFSLSGIRQALAISIFIFALPFVINHKKLKYVATIVLAFLFHKSALFFLPIYWIMNMEVNRKNLLYVMIGLAFIYTFAEPFLLTAADIMNYDYEVERTGNGFIFTFIVLFITIVCYKYKGLLMQNKSSNKYLINANYISLGLWVIRLVSQTAERLSLYVMPYTYVLLEQYLSSRPKKQKTGYMIIAILLSTYLFIHRMSPSESLNNFTFFWQ